MKTDARGSCGSPRAQTVAAGNRLPGHNTCCSSTPSHCGFTMPTGHITA